MKYEPLPRNWIAQYLRAYSGPWSGECSLPRYPLADDDECDGGGCSRAGEEHPRVVKVGLSALMSEGWRERNLSC